MQLIGNVFGKITLRSVLYFVLLFFLVCVFNDLMTYFTIKLNDLISSQDGITPHLWLYIVGQVVFNFLFEVGMFLTGCLLFFPNVASRFLYFLNQSLIESIRAWGKILLGFVCLVLPGLILLMRYLLVPYVVVFDKKYDAGQVDALKRSSHIYATMSFLNWVLLLFLKLGIPLLLMIFFENNQRFLEAPISFSISSLIQSLTLVVSIYVIQMLIKKHFEEDYEPNVLMERN